MKALDLASRGGRTDVVNILMENAAYARKKIIQGRLFYDPIMWSAQSPLGLALEHNETKDAFVCEICPKKVFFNRLAFQKHIENQH